MFLRCAFFALFASALVHKVFHFTSFQGTVATYLRGVALATGGVTLGATFAIVVGEILAATACVAPVVRMLRAGMIAGMLLLYAAAMGLNLLRGNALLDCGCHWGSLRQPVGYALVWRNLFMALVALALAVPAGDRPMQAIDGATIVASTALVALLYAVVNRASAGAAQVYGKS